MPRYFFNVHDESEIIDTVGTELPDLAAVRREAVLTTGELLPFGSSASLWSGDGWKLVVSDEAGAEVLTLRLSGADCL